MTDSPLPPRRWLLALADAESARALADALERAGYLAPPLLLLLPVRGQPDSAAFAAEVADRLRAEAVEVVLIESSLSPGRRSDLSGARLARALRRDHDFAGVFIFTGFLSRAAAAGRCSLLGPDVPGSEYLRLPASAAALGAAVADARGPLSRTELDAVVRRDHDGIAEGIRARVHALAGRLNQTAASGGAAGARYAGMLRARRDLDELCAYLDRFGFSEAAAMLDSALRRAADVAQGPNGFGSAHVADLLRALEAVGAIATGGHDPEVSVGEELTDGPDAAIPDAPDGYENILIADDGVYSPAFHAWLAARGYVVAVEATEAGANTVLEADPSPVFLCDQTLDGDPGAGRRLMRKARRIAECRLVVALSGSWLTPDEAPEAHLVLSGPTARTEEGAKRLHGEICRWANRDEKDGRR